MNVLLLTISIVALILLIAAMIMLPSKAASSKIILSQDSDIDESMKKILRMFGGDILNNTPSGILKSNIQGEKMEKLFKDSGNPWKVTMQEFYLIRVIYAFIGVLAAVVVCGLLALMGYGPIFYVATLIFPVIGYIYPKSAYQSVANYRNTRFKVELPEAIDYLTMALSGGGYALSGAIEEAAKYISPGIIKDEFDIMVSDLNAGKTIEATLTAFADRAPTDGIRSFTRALINANRLSVSMIDILKIRARESRRDLENEIEQRVTKLPTRVSLVLSPTSSIAIMGVAMAPSVAALGQLLG